ncbi:MAG: DNA N-6-adenine-methyltransferase [Leptolyngbyaceae bacterium]|nr:DNA N-6-adenine-methyltransferase [Leptolyngbyaceae bacterium]
MNVHFSSETDMWATPQDLFDKLNAEHGFTLDVCAVAENAKCAKYYTPEMDGLSCTWHGVIWCNPPYGRGIGAWVKKVYETSLMDWQHAGYKTVMLLPARTDTKWFHDYCTKGKITFIKGRLKFGGHKNSAPFPSMIVVFEP